MMHAPDQLAATHIVGESIRHAAETAVRKIVAEQQNLIEAKIREALSGDDIARAVTKAFVKEAANDWRITVNFDTEKEKR